MTRQLPLMLLPVLLVSCAGDESTLAVNTFHLKKTEVVGRDSAMIRGEQRRRLHGAVTKDEQEQRLGEYFTVRWNLNTPKGKAALARTGQTKVVLLYRQAGTASKILKMSQPCTEGKLKGACEFHVKGDDYHKNGRVLAWRVELRHGGELLDSQQSYMWE